MYEFLAQIYEHDFEIRIFLPHISVTSTHIAYITLEITLDPFFLDTEMVVLLSSFIYI